MSKLVRKAWTLPPQEELIVWGKKQWPFLAAYLLVFLLAIQSGKSLSEAFGVLYLYALNAAISYLVRVSQEVRTK